MAFVWSCYKPLLLNRCRRRRQETPGRDRTGKDRHFEKHKTTKCVGPGERSQVIICRTTKRRRFTGLGAITFCLPIEIPRSRKYPNRSRALRTEHIMYTCKQIVFYSPIFDAATTAMKNTARKRIIEFVHAYVLTKKTPDSIFRFVCTNKHKTGVVNDPFHLVGETPLRRV